MQIQPDHTLIYLFNFIIIISVIILAVLVLAAVAVGIFFLVRFSRENKTHGNSHHHE